MDAEEEAYVGVPGPFREGIPQEVEQMLRQGRVSDLVQREVRLGEGHLLGIVLLVLEVVVVMMMVVLVSGVGGDKWWLR